MANIPFLNNAYFAAKVGIGTDSPIGKLEVRSSVVRTSVNGGADELVLQNAGYSGMTILSSNTTAAQIHFGDDAMTNTGMIQYWNSTNSMTFSTNGGSERMRIDSSGNVGIGTTSPQYPLHVAGSSSVTAPTGNGVLMGLYNGTHGHIQMNGSSGSYIDFSQSGVDHKGRILYDNGANYLRLDTNGTEKMRITSTGGISFGSTGTAYGVSGQILKSNGNASPTWIDGSAIPGVPAGSGTLNTVPLWTPNGDTLGDSPITISGNNATFAGQVEVASASNQIKLSTGTAGDGYLNIGHFSNGAFIGTYGDDGGAADLIRFGTYSGDEKMRIDSSGQVIFKGTGNSIDLRFKDISAAISSETAGYIGMSTSGYSGNNGDLVLIPRTSAASNILLMQGNVGIGTTAPQTILHLKSGGSPSLRIQDSDGTDQYATINHNNGSNQYIARNNTSNGQHIWYGQTATSSFNERMRIDSSGNVGIGTTTPNTKLHVYTSGVNRVSIESDNNANQVYQSTAGASGYNQYTFRQMGGTITSPTQLGGGYDIGHIIFQGYDGAVMQSVAGIRIRNSATITSASSPADINFETTTAGSVTPTTKMTILSGGNVGIGTTSPDRQLQVHESTSGTSTAKFTNSTTGEDGDTGFFVGINGSEQPILFGYNSTDMIIGTNGSEKMRITSAGNVGIGTTSPTYKLDVNGDAARIGSSSQTTTTLYLTATNTAGSPAMASEIIMQGYEGRGIGTFYQDTTYTGEEWFAGMPYSGGFNYYQIGYDASGGQAEYAANSLFRVYHNGKTILSTYGSGTHTGTAAKYLAVTSSGEIIETGSGGVLPGGPYLPLAGGTMTGVAGVVFPDAFKLNLGTGSDLQISHDGFDSYINNINSSLNIRNSQDDGDIYFQSDNGSGGIATYFYLDGSLVNGTSIKGATIFPDSSKIYMGDSADLEIFHDGSNSYIKDNGIGDLRFMASNIKFYDNATAELMAQMIPNGAVELYYNNSKKFETTSSGVTVTGDIQIDSALLSNQENTDIDSAAAEMVAQVAIATYTAAFFDFVVKKSTNVRSGTVYACHDGTNVEFTETSTQDLGDTSDVTLSVDISGGNMRLLATVTSDDWSIKSLIKAI